MMDWGLDIELKDIIKAIDGGISHIVPGERDWIRKTMAYENIRCFQPCRKFAK